MKILIVDDSRLVRIKLKAELFDRGHTVIEARDGEEALRRIADKSPDAVFSTSSSRSWTAAKFCVVCVKRIRRSLSSCFQRRHPQKTSRTPTKTVRSCSSKSPMPMTRSRRHSAR